MNNRYAESSILVLLVYTIVQVSIGYGTPSCIETLYGSMPSLSAKVDNILTCLRESYQLETDWVQACIMLADIADEIESTLSVMEERMIKMQWNMSGIDTIFTTYSRISEGLQATMSSLQELKYELAQNEIFSQPIDTITDKYRGVGTKLRSYDFSAYLLNTTLMQLNHCMPQFNYNPLGRETVAQFCGNAAEYIRNMDEVYSEIHRQCEAPVSAFNRKLTSSLDELLNYVHVYLPGLAEYARFYNESVTKEYCLFSPPASYQVPEMPPGASFNNPPFRKRSLDEENEMPLEHGIQGMLEVVDMCQYMVSGSENTSPHYFGCYSIEELTRNAAIGTGIMEQIELTLSDYSSYFAPRDFPDITVLKDRDMLSFLSGMNTALDGAVMDGVNLLYYSCEIMANPDEFCGEMLTCISQLAGN